MSLSEGDARTVTYERAWVWLDHKRNCLGCSQTGIMGIDERRLRCPVGKKMLDQVFESAEFMAQ